MKAYIKILITYLAIVYLNTLASFQQEAELKKNLGSRLPITRYAINHKIYDKIRKELLAIELCQDVINIIMEYSDKRYQLIRKITNNKSEYNTIEHMACAISYPYFIGTFHPKTTLRSNGKPNFGRHLFFGACNISKDETITPLCIPLEKCLGASFSPNNKLLATTGILNKKTGCPTTVIWETQNWTEKIQIKNTEGASIFYDDNTIIISRNNNILFFDITTNQPTNTYQTTHAPIKFLRLSKDKKILAVASNYTKELIIINIAQQKQHTHNLEDKIKRDTTSPIELCDTMSLQLSNDNKLACLAMRISIHATSISREHCVYDIEKEKIVLLSRDTHATLIETQKLTQESFLLTDNYAYPGKMAVVDNTDIIKTNLNMLNKNNQKQSYTKLFKLPAEMPIYHLEASDNLIIICTLTGYFLFKET